MGSENATPNTFPAKSYETGDRFAFEIRPEEEYEIFGRKIDGTGVVQFSVRRSNEPGAEPVEYQMTFPEDMSISARRRIRHYNPKCMLCKKPHFVEVDTAYYTLNSVVCGNH